MTYTHWKGGERPEKRVKRELYKVLVKAKVEDISEIARKIMRVLKES